MTPDVQLVRAATEAAPDHENEDAYRTGDGWALVLDGASRYPTEHGGCVHRVAWVVERLADHLAARLTADSGTPLNEILRDAITATKRDHGPGCDLAHPLSPGATVAIVRSRDQSVETLVLGDCAAVVERAPGDFVVALDDRVDRLPAAPVVGGAVLTYDPAYVATVRNRIGGFWVAGAVEQAADHALLGEVEIRAGARVLLCSDGVSRLTERYGWTWSQVWDLVDAAGPAGVIAAVRRAEAEEPDPPRFRGKRHDDATLVTLQLA